MSLGKFGLALGGLSLALVAVPALAADDDKPSTSLDASKGGYTIKSGDNSVTFGMYAQARALYEDKEQFDADTTGSGVGSEDGGSASFDVARVRLSLKGTMFRSWLKYGVSYELGRTSGESANKLKDAYLEVAKNSMATFRLGQFKVPFSLQELTGDQYQSFVDRSITNAFAPGRDAGAMLYGTTASKNFGYQVGLFNGSGESKRQDDQSLMHAVRIWFDPFGEYKLREGTDENPEGNILHFGLGYRGGEAMKGGTAGVFEDPNDQTAYNVEFAWKYSRFFATAEYVSQTDEQANPTVGPDVDSEGWHVQTGWMVRPASLELGLRYATLDPNKDVDNDKTTEIRGVVNWLFKGHNLKLQGDLGQLTYEPASPTRGSRLAPAGGEDVSDLQARLQFQVTF